MDEPLRSHARTTNIVHNQGDVQMLVRLEDLLKIMAFLGGVGYEIFHMPPSYRLEFFYDTLHLRFVSAVQDQVEAVAVELFRNTLSDTYESGLSVQERINLKVMGIPSVAPVRRAYGSGPRTYSLTEEGRMK